MKITIQSNMKIVFKTIPPKKTYVKYYIAGKWKSEYLICWGWEWEN